MRLVPILLSLAAVAAAMPAMAADDTAAELRRLAQRMEALEQQNKELGKALATDRISENEPEVVTRLKAVEFQTLSMQKQARQIEALEGITAGANLIAVVQSAGKNGTASGARETLANYRGDIAVTLPGGEMGDTEGRIFTQLRFGQGNGVGLRPTYTSTPNTTAFQVGSVAADDSFAILAQAWYQLSTPLLRGGVKANARERIDLTFGKIDPFVFFDQNAAADDESAKFINNAFVHNPLLDSGGDVGADAYGFAPGAIVQYVNESEKGSEWGLSVGVFGSGTGANFTGSISRPLVIAQAETAARFNFLPGNYRVYVWTNGNNSDYDGVTRRHSGVGFSVDQKADDAFTVFVRYGQQLDGKVRFDRALTVGGELGGSGWSRAADSLGVAFGTLRTSDDYRNESTLFDLDGDGAADPQASGSETQAELYYRYKVNSQFELTPDFQLIRRPSGDGAGETIKVAGLRAKIGF